MYVRHQEHAGVNDRIPEQAGDAGQGIGSGTRGCESEPYNILKLFKQHHLLHQQSVLTSMSGPCCHREQPVSHAVAKMFLL